MKKIELLLFIFLCYINIAVAQNTTMGIAECQQMAQENYPLVKRYGLIEQTVDFTVKNIEKGWLPQINASVQATLQSTVVALPDALEQMLKSKGTDVRGVSHFQYRAGVDKRPATYRKRAIGSAEGCQRCTVVCTTRESERPLFRCSPDRSTPTHQRRDATHDSSQP
ncbi:MAG: hypothetical protein Q3994_00545 [Prevotella sp.]|nr:hypothetical protein [Prevotella sp.]